jgi:ankyrin repeat protein
MTVTQAAFKKLIRAISDGNTAEISRLLAAAPGLVDARAKSDLFLDAIAHYMYSGDTAVHIAAAAYQATIVRSLIAAGADVRALNRRGAQPLHYAADGVPGAPSWNPRAQAATIAALIKAGADPNAADKSGVTPLHRAVRTRSAAAVEALLAAGANPRCPNKNGSIAVDLASQTTGRGGSGSPAAKAQQQEILQLLEKQMVP